MIEHSKSTEFYVAIQEFKYDGDLCFVVHLSTKPFPKRLTRWSDNVITEVIVTKSGERYSDRIKYVIKWQGGRRFPCSDWKHAMRGFHNHTNRIRKNLGFERKYTQWKEPKVKKE